MFSVIDLQSCNTHNTELDLYSCGLNINLGKECRINVDMICFVRFALFTILICVFYEVTVMRSIKFPATIILQETVLCKILWFNK